MQANATKDTWSLIVASMEKGEGKLLTADEIELEKACATVRPSVCTLCACIDPIGRALQRRLV